LPEIKLKNVKENRQGAGAIGPKGIWAGQKGIEKLFELFQYFGFKSRRFKHFQTSSDLDSK
jgi:hypothetical protein